MNEDNEHVGSVAEEAAKLLGALQDWAKEHGQESETAAAGAASAFRTLNEHIATEDENCKYCPVCQLISVVRKTSPEVRQHLGTAATSLLQAAAAAMATTGKPSASDSPLEKIDLADPGDVEDDPWDRL